MRFRIDAPQITGKTEAEKTSQIVRFLIKLTERLNMMFDGVAYKDAVKEELDALKAENVRIKAEVEANREYIRELYSKNGALTLPEKITWGK